MNTEKRLKIGTFSAVLMALGINGAAAQAAGFGPGPVGGLGSGGLVVRPGTLPIGGTTPIQPVTPGTPVLGGAAGALDQIILTDKLVVKKILKDGIVQPLASGYNQINEYKQGSGSDTFTQYSQVVENAPLSQLTVSPSLSAKMKSLNLIR